MENIRSKPNSNNNRINRWIEKIQEFDFSIVYRKPETLVGPDALSRLYETSPVENKTKTKKTLDTKQKNHIITIDNNQFWQFDNGMKKMFLSEEERLNIVKQAHIDTNHRRMDGTYYEVKKKYYWIGLKNTVKML